MDLNKEESSLIYENILLAEKEVNRLIKRDYTETITNKAKKDRQIIRGLLNKLEENYGQ